MCALVCLCLFLVIFLTDTQKSDFEEAASRTNLEAKQISTSITEISNKSPLKPPQLSLPTEANEPAPAAKLRTMTDLRKTFADIAQRYEKSMRFPPYSKPLSSRDWALLNPRPFLSLKVPVTGMPQAEVELELPNYIVDVSKDLPIIVRAYWQSKQSSAQLVTVSVQLRNQFGNVGSQVPLNAKRPAIKSANHDVGMSDLGLSDVSKESNFSRSGNATENAQPRLGVSVFAGNIKSQILQSAGAGKLTVLAHLTFSDGHHFTTAAQLKAFETVATLTHIGPSFIDGAHLMLPAFFAVESSGRYRIRANLFDAQTNRPISHLTSYFSLQAPEDSAVLKVYAVTLRAQSAPGPYKLGQIEVTCLPKSPGDSTKYGNTLNKTYDVNGLGLAQYSDEPYQNNKLEQRLQFLQRLSEGKATGM
jgi:hypothetical protein